MLILKNITFFVILALILFANAQDYEIHQIKDGHIRINGKLDEWGDKYWYPLSYNYDGSHFSPSDDLDVKVKFAFDTENFYIAVKAVDDMFETVNRGWRYGDGFYFTLVNDYKEQSRYQIQYGFAKGQKILVYKNGAYFLRGLPGDIKFDFRQDGESCGYEVKIPFEHLKPFNPFIDKRIPINVIYCDRDNGNRKPPVLLTPDSGYDTESSQLRKGAFFALVPEIPVSEKYAVYHFGLKKNFFKSGEEININYAFNVDKPYNNRKITAELRIESGVNLKKDRNVNLKRGLNQGSFSLNFQSISTGKYRLSCVLEDERNRKVSEFEDEIFYLNNEEFTGILRKIGNFKNNAKLSLSLPVLEIRFEWFKEFYESRGYENINPLSEWNSEIQDLYALIEDNKSALPDKDRVKRYAHRSKIDDTLQPYSVSFPKDFKSELEMMQHAHKIMQEEKDRLCALG